MLPSSHDSSSGSSDDNTTIQASSPSSSSCSVQKPPLLQRRHVSLPSIDAVSLLGLCGLAYFLSSHLLSYPSDHHAMQPPSYPLYSVLAPITQMPGASLTLYLLPCWRSVGVLVPGNDAMTTHPLSSFSPGAAEVGKWVVGMLEASKALAVLLPLLAALCPRAWRDKRRRNKMAMKGGGSSRKSQAAAFLLLVVGTAVSQPVLGAALSFLGSLLGLLSLCCFPLLFARDISINPTDHPLLLGVSPQEVVFRFVYWDNKERIDDPCVTTIFRGEASLVLVAALAWVWVGMGCKLILPSLSSTSSAAPSLSVLPLPSLPPEKPLQVEDVTRRMDEVMQ